jgi:hypothetical protein
MMRETFHEAGETLTGLFRTRCHHPGGAHSDSSSTGGIASGGQRLGDIVIHARREAPLAIALHRVRGQRHDRLGAAPLSRSARVAS